MCLLRAACSVCVFVSAVDTQPRITRGKEHWGCGARTEQNRNQSTGTAAGGWGEEGDEGKFGLYSKLVTAKMSRLLQEDV